MPSPVHNTKHLDEALARLTSAYQKEKPVRLVSGSAALQMAAWVASGAGTVFTPTDVSNCVLWLRPDMGLTVVGSGVDTWNDQSGAGMVMRQTDDAKRMPLTSSDAGYGNQPVISSSVITQCLVASAGYASSQPHTAFVVGECHTANGAFFATGDSSNNGWLMLDSGSLKVFAGSTLIDAHATTSPCVMMGIFNGNGTSSFAGVSNWLTGGTSGAAGTAPTVRWALGAYTDGLFGAVCKIAEVIVYNKVVSAPEKALLAKYFTARYGLAIT
jgi:hypothetical protein